VRCGWTELPLHVWPSRAADSVSPSMKAPGRLVMVDGSGREVDMPTAEPRGAEASRSRWPDATTMALPRAALRTGRILGVEVPALSAEVHARTGFRYPLAKSWG
jgi:hypothetical protein